MGPHHGSFFPIHIHIDALLKLPFSKVDDLAFLKSANMLLYCIQVLSACFQSLQQLSKLAFSFISAVFHRIARVPLIRRSVGSWEPVFPRAAAAPRRLHDNTLRLFYIIFIEAFIMTLINCGHSFHIKWHPSHILSLL